MLFRSLQRGSFTGSASLPYLVIDAPASVISRGGGHYIVDPAAPSKRRRREGIGNLLLMGSYALDVGDAPYSLGLGGSVTLPTASKSKGLGTGEVDYGVSANAAYTVGTFAPFLDLGYALPGKSDSFSLNNTLSVSAGTTNTLNDALLASLSFNYEESIANGSKESEQIYGSLTWTLTPKVSLTAYGAAGLAKGSPDLDTGLLFVFGL